MDGERPASGAGPTESGTRARFWKAVLPAQTGVPGPASAAGLRAGRAKRAVTSGEGAPLRTAGVPHATGRLLEGSPPAPCAHGEAGTPKPRGAPKPTPQVQGGGGRR